ncbi:MAG: endonuclease III [Patescibacteria group bacterium]
MKDYAAVLKALSKRYTDPAMIDFGNAEDTLIATLLSARTTDVQVLKLYPGLRKKFPKLQNFAEADVRDIAKALSTIGLYRQKAKAIKELSRILIAKHGGKVPKTMDELIALPGVGRKTASCVLAYAFNIPAIAVDTHVFRIAKRLGWAKGKDAFAVEKELRRTVPENLWISINRAFVPFGREFCKPGKPLCYVCPVRDRCAFANKTKAPSSSTLKT